MKATPSPQWTLRRTSPTPAQSIQSGCFRSLLKPSSLRAVILTGLSCLIALPAARALPAFPGAEGFGAVTRGAYSGSATPQILFVTNTNDSGPGSFRAAVTASGPRVVVFRVGGTIENIDWIYVSNPYITIMGQTAPGGGICIKGETLKLKTHDVVVRGMRFRPGNALTVLGQTLDNRDGMGIEGSNGPYNVIVDHCSFSWSVDELLQVWSSAGNIHDITLQWCIFSEALKSAGHTKGTHSMGPLVGWGSENVSFHHNYLAHSDYRQPRFDGGTSFEFVNNVVYNYGTTATQLNDSSDSPGIAAFGNLVRNYYKVGPSTVGGTRSGILIGHSGAVPAAGSLYYLQGNIDCFRTDDSMDEWGCVGVVGTYNPTWRVSSPVVSSSSISQEDSAFETRFSVLNNAGAIVPRDTVDLRVLSDFYKGTGSIINNPSAVGGYPAYATGTAPADSDNDGIPDSWETARLLNPLNAADAHTDRDSDGYTNLEEYGNGLFAGSLVTQTLEGEAASATVSSGDTTTVNSDGSASGGQYRYFTGNAVGDWIDLGPWSGIPAGDYTVMLRYKKQALLGQFKLKIDGVLASEKVDQYGNGGIWVNEPIGNFYFDGTNKTMRLEVTGTTGGSYRLWIDKISLVPSFVNRIKDNTDASDVAIIGSWTTDTAGGGFYGINYFNDGNTAKGTKSVRFTPRIPAAGNYEVFAQWVAGANRASNVPIDIIHSGGTTTKTIDQRSNGSAWYSLGTYAFAAGATGNVLIRTTGTNGYVVADAVKFSPR